MNTLVISLVGLSALLHAGWNLICKKQKSSNVSFFLLFATGSVMFWLPFVILVFRSHEVNIPIQVWCILVSSGLANAIYYAGLGRAYQISDISMSYPLVKALPILMITLFCLSIKAEATTFWGIAGIMFLLMGSLLMPMKKFSNFSIRNYLNRSCIFILIAATASAGYMLLDSEGMKILKSMDCTMKKYQLSIVYIFFENLFILPFLSIFIVSRKAGRIQLQEFLRNFSIAPFFTGIMCTISYSLVLAAMLFTDNVSFIVALRQISVPLGAFAGIVFLKEPGYSPKVSGALVIVGGLFLVYMA